MGDVLPPKRQTVVDRLRRRFELYRRHQNACLPRYEQAANGLYEAQKQETLLLKQRFLESKAKKAKNSKNDHHRSTYKESTPDGSKAQLHAKPLKRVAEESPANSIQDPTNEEVEKPSKIARTEVLSDKSCVSEAQKKKKQSSPLQSFSVQIVQQFTNASQAHHSQTIQTNVTVQTLSGSAPQPSENTNNQTSQSITVTQGSQQKENKSSTITVTGSSSNVECKQEKDNGHLDLCQCNSQTSNSCSGGDRLSDTFPSLGFTDDSGDDVIHPDILKDLIDDVLTNSADIMKDFNFEDSVGSIKDPDDIPKEIIDALKASPPPQQRPFQREDLTFANAHSNQQQNGVFENVSANASTSPTITSSFYTTPSQRLPSYSVSGLSLSNGLGLDFKLSEPSPAALTLKQMAEQHQNMQKQQQQQQQQLVNSPLVNRTQSFNQESFSGAINTLRTNFFNGSNTAIPSVNSSKSHQQSSNNMFSTFEHSYPGIKPINSGMFKQELQVSSSPVEIVVSEEHSKRSLGPTRQRIEQHKALPFNANRNLPYYSDNASTNHPSNVNNHHQHPMGNFQSNSDMRLQMNQSQQIHIGQHNPQQLQSNNSGLKQQQNVIQPQSNMYGSYPSQQPGNNLFHVSMSQSMSYSTQFGSNSMINRPPPEYKSHHSNMASDSLHIAERMPVPSHVNFHQMQKGNYIRSQNPPNIVANSSGPLPTNSTEWRHAAINQQHGQFRMSSYTPPENYNSNYVTEKFGSTVPRSQIYHQYRMASNNGNLNRAQRPTMTATNHAMIQQRQRITLQPRTRNMPINNMDQLLTLPVTNNNANPINTMDSVYNSHQDLSRQDGSQINLDFLDNIKSSASDLLNFDQVMPSGGSHFPLLEDIEILGK